MNIFKTFHFIIFLLLPLFFIAQVEPNKNRVIDSLLQSYENTNQEGQKIEIGQLLIEKLLHKDRQQAFQLNEETFSNAVNSKDPIVKAKAYYYAHLFVNMKPESDQALALNYLDTATTISKQNSHAINEVDFQKLQLGIQNGRGVYFYNAGEFEKAILYYQNALDIAEDLNEVSRIASINYNIAIIHYVLDNYEEALPRLKSTYEYALENDQGNIEAGSLTILGASYQLLDSFDLAKHYLRKSIQLAKEEGLERIYLEALIAMSLVMEDSEEYDSAFHYLRLSMGHSTLGVDPLVDAQQYINLARLENKRGNIDEARKWFRKAKATNDHLDRKEVDIQYLIDIAELEYLDGNYQLAYKYMRDGHFKQDSFNSKENKSLIKELELKYGKEKDEKQLALQELKLEKKQRKISNLTTGAIFSLLGMILFYGFYRNAKEKEDKVKSELDIKNLKLESMEKQNSILALTSTLQGQEAERARIANDLHDGLGTLLSSVKAHFSNIQGEIKKIESINMYDKAQSMMDNACDEVRRISHNLMPPLLRSQGTAAAIENLVGNFSATSATKFTLDIRNMEQRLSDTQEVFLYRICQELLNNIKKHADASNVEISIYGLDESIQLIVEDDGKGFNVNEQVGGMGLNSVRSRVEYFNGELEINSALGKGTTISIVLPKIESNEQDQSIYL